MSDQIERLDRFKAPYQQEVTLSKVTFESGMELMRVTIREGHRITSFDIDAETAERWAAGLSSWAGAQRAAVPAGGPDEDPGDGPDGGE